MSKLGIVRVAAASPALKIANPSHNEKEILKLMLEAEEKGAGILLPLNSHLQDIQPLTFSIRNFFIQSSLKA